MNNYERSISNIIFWIENPELVTRLYSIQGGEIKTCVTEERNGEQLIYSNNFYVESAATTTIQTLLKYYFGITDPIAFSNFYYRYIKTYLNETNEDDYFLTLPEVMHLVMLPSVKHNMDSIIATSREGFCMAHKHFPIDSYTRDALLNGWMVDYTIKSISFDEYIEKVFAIHMDKVAAYRSGRVGLFNMLFGEVMKSLPNKNIDKQALSIELKARLEE